MNADQARAMFELSDKLDNLEFVLRLKCEICGPILRGADKSKYPACKRHVDK
jgi:hypothetical protein